MSALLFLQLIIFAMATCSSAGAGATWCVCKEGISDKVLQKTIDYACGAGADCNQILQNGACFNPNTVRAHCNYAVNSYFQKNTQTSGSCDFSGTAMLLTSNPSSGGCVYPAIASVTATATATATTPTSGSTTPSATTATSTNKAPAGTTPLITPSTGVLGGGVNNGFGGPALYPEEDEGGILLLKSSIFLSTLVTSLSSALVVFWWA